MNILYICPKLPYPTDRGDKLVIYNQIKFLSRRNKITLLTFIENKDELRYIPELSRYCSRVETFTKRPNFSMRNFLIAACKTGPFNVIRYFSNDMLRRAKTLIESGEFEVIHVAFYFMAQYAISKDITVPRSTAVILDTHNVEYIIYSKYASLAKNPLIKLDSLRIKNYEPRMYRKFDRCIAFSDLDRENIAMLSGVTNIVVNPPCVELSDTQSVGQSREEANTLFYFGCLNTLANRDAVKFFYQKIFPLIKKEIPAAKFVIAGKQAPGFIRDLAGDSSVRLLGLVPDIREALKKMAVVVVPLRIGGGTRIKVLESWASRRAVVSTSAGAEGVQVENGSDIAIADSPEDFAKEAIKLLKDKARRERLGSAAYKKISELYNPERVTLGLENIYDDALKEKNARSERIKALFIWQPAVGGVQRHAISLLEKIDRNKFEMFAVFPPGAESVFEALNRARVKIYPVKMHREIKPISDLSAFFKIYRFIKEEKFDIVHIHSSKAGFLGRIAARLAGVKVVIYTPHSFAFDRPARMWFQRIFYALAERFAALFCDRIIAVCEDEKKLAMKALSLPAEKIEVISNAVNLPSCDIKFDVVKKREELGIARGDKIIVFVGRVAPQKAPLDLVKAMEEVKKDKAGSNAVCLILGDGPLLEMVKRYVRKKEYSDFIKILGWRKDTKEIIASGDVFVLPSLWEVLPNHSLLDAMALKKPIVTTDTLGSGEMVIDGQNGFIVPRGKPQLMAQAILKILKLDSSALSEYGLRSRKIAEDRGDLQKSVDKIEKLYEKLLCQKRNL